MRSQLASSVDAALLSSALGLQRTGPEVAIRTVAPVSAHPVWWGEANVRPDLRLATLVSELTCRVVCRDEGRMTRRGVV